MWGEEGAYRDLFAPILSFVETSLSAALQARSRGRRRGCALLGVACGRAVQQRRQQQRAREPGGGSHNSGADL